MFSGRADWIKTLVSTATENAPLTYNGENGVSTFSRLLLIRSFFVLGDNEDMHNISDDLEFRPDRTEPLTTELAALEHLKMFP